MHVIADRAEAIRVALAEAGAGDVVLIAGKGHEDYQIVGAETPAVQRSRRRCSTRCGGGGMMRDLAELAAAWPAARCTVRDAAFGR
ncbi:MAG: hypothetical protein MZV65_34515 [Chromatiales bacterium]|nr:hypothetical protein [Chromatiales bacterium]